MGQQDAPFLCYRETPFALIGEIEAGALPLCVFLSSVRNIMVPIPVEETLVHLNEERARAACGINDPDGCGFGFGGFAANVAYRFAFQNPTERLADDVADDVGRRVVNTACLLDFWLFLNSRRLPGQGDDFPEKLLINLPQNVGWQYRKFIGALWVIKA